MPITTEPHATASGGTAISFGPYRLLPTQRLLLEGDQPVRLGSRAFDILATLLERASEVVGKEELIARAWPKTFVEDANLKIQISAYAAPWAMAKTAIATSPPFQDGVTISS